MTEVTGYRWCPEHGGPESDQARRRKEWELGKPPLRKAVADLALDKFIRAEAAKTVSIPAH